MAIRGIVFDLATMVIGGIIFGLTATGIRSNVVCRTTLEILVTIVILHRATLVIRGVVICCPTTAICNKHNNQPKEECTAKMPETEAKQQATTNWHNERTRGQHNMNASATTAMGRITMARVTMATTTTMTTMLSVLANIKG
jgi:hypothetical protein